MPQRGDTKTGDCRYCDAKNVTLTMVIDPEDSVFYWLCENCEIRVEESEDGFEVLHRK